MCHLIYFSPGWLLISWHGHEAKSHKLHLVIEKFTVYTVLCVTFLDYYVLILAEMAADHSSRQGDVVRRIPTTAV
jgi:hypothetical protein